MRFGKSVFFVLMALVLVGTSVVPVQAASIEAKDTVQVQFQNKTGDSVRLTLTGPATRSLTLSTGKTKADLAPGRYNYSYEACGKTNTGVFKALKNGDTLVLAKCKGDNGGGGTVKVVIKNNTGGNITIYLTGPQSYTFNFPTGSSRMEVVPGKYTYTVYGCGSSITGTKSFKGGGINWMFWCY